MAVNTDNLALLQSANGFNLFRYDTDDAATSVDTSGYFNNSDDDINMAVGDVILLVVWASAVRTSTISDVAIHIVVSVSSAGVVDLSADLLGATVSDSD